MRPSVHPLLLLTTAAVTLGCSLFTAPQSSTGAGLEMAADESPAPESFTLVVVHPSQGDLQDLLAAHAERAAAAGRRPYVEFSADWCPPCVALAKSLADPRMVEAFRGTYVLRLDFDEWKSRLPGTRFIVVGVPTFFELDSSGAPTGRIITGAAWGEDIPENMAPPLQDFFRSGSAP